MTESDSQFGNLLYEARLRAPLRVLILVVILFPTLAAVVGLASWVALSWGQRSIYVFVAVVFPIVIAEALLRRVCFYEHGIVYRTWTGRERRFDYEQIRAFYGERTSKLAIYPREGKVIEIPKSEGDLDLIADLIRARRPSS